MIRCRMYYLTQPPHRDLNGKRDVTYMMKLGGGGLNKERTIAATA